MTYSLHMCCYFIWKFVCGGKKTASTSCTCTNIKSIIIIVLYANRASEWRIQIRSTDYLRTRRFITRLHRRFQLVLWTSIHLNEYTDERDFLWVFTTSCLTENRPRFPAQSWAPRRLAAGKYPKLCGWPISPASSANWPRTLFPPTSANECVHII